MHCFADSWRVEAPLPSTSLLLLRCHVMNRPVPCQWNWQRHIQRWPWSLYPTGCTGSWIYLSGSILWNQTEAGGIDWVCEKMYLVKHGDFTSFTIIIWKAWLNVQNVSITNLASSVQHVSLAWHDLNDLPWLSTSSPTITKLTSKAKVFKLRNEITLGIPVRNVANPQPLKDSMRENSSLKWYGRMHRHKPT